MLNAAGLGLGGLARRGYRVGFGLCVEECLEGSDGRQGKEKNKEDHVHNHLPPQLRVFLLAAPNLAEREEDEGQHEG